MKPTFQQRNEFLAHKPLPGVLFEHNDFVSIIGNASFGDAGSIISVEEFGDDPLYLVELSSGKDAFVRQSCLLRLEA